MFNLEINLDSTAILIILTLSIHKHGIFYHLFNWFFKIMFCNFQSTHISFVKFNPKHFLIIDDIANGIVFLIFL